MQTDNTKRLLETFIENDIQIKVFDENFGEFITKIRRKYVYKISKKTLEISNQEFEIEEIISIRPINLSLEERIDKINACDDLIMALAYTSEEMSSYEIEALETIKAKYHYKAILKRICEIKRNIHKELSLKHSKLNTESILSHMLLNISKIVKIDEIKNLAQLNEYTQKAICKAIKACENDIF